MKRCGLSWLDSLAVFCLDQEIRFFALNSHAENQEKSLPLMHASHLLESKEKGENKTMTKGPFLLDKAVRIPMKESIGEYDSARSLNVTAEHGRQVPVVSVVGAPPTHSKTMCAPGDDDPDPGQERCY